MKSPDDFESRLRTYLSDGAQTKAPAGIESRIERRIFGRPRSWSMQILAAAAIVVLAVGLGIALRSVHQANQGLAGGGPTVSPSISASASPAPTGKPSPETSATAQPGQSPYPLLAPASMHMVSPTTGWAAGSTTDRILRTGDGGAHWEDVTPSAAARGNWTTFFLDSDNAWLASSTQPGAATGDFSVQIYRTADGGRNWWHAGTAAPGWGFPAAIDFVDRQHGWLFVKQDGTLEAPGSDRIAVYGTADGGATWSRLTESDTSGIAGHLPTACSKSAPVFLNATTGWIPGGCGNDGGFLLYVTRDGGRNWAAVALRVPPQGTLTCDCSIESLRFWDQQHGALVLDNASQDARGYAENFLYTTRDGGRSWQLGPMLPINAFSVYVLDATHAWTLDAKSNSILFSTDGGLHWSTAGTVPSNSNGVVWDFQFTTADVGWVLGADSGGLPILKSIDGGRSWTAQLTP